MSTITQIASATADPNTTSKGDTRMTKKQTGEPETVSSDYVLMQVTLTVAVESYICDEHAEQRHEAAIEQILDRFSPADWSRDEIMVLASTFTPLTLKADRA